MLCPFHTFLVLRNLKDINSFIEHNSICFSSVIELIKKGDKSDKSTRRPSTAAVNNNNSMLNLLISPRILNISTQIWIKEFDKLQVV